MTTKIEKHAEGILKAMDQHVKEYTERNDIAMIAYRESVRKYMYQQQDELKVELKRHLNQQIGMYAIWLLGFVLLAGANTFTILTTPNLGFVDGVIMVIMTAAVGFVIYMAGRLIGTYPTTYY
jgi:hypothetical protein